MTEVKFMGTMMYPVLFFDFWRMRVQDRIEESDCNHGYKMKLTMIKYNMRQIETPTIDKCYFKRRCVIRKHSDGMYYFVVFFMEKIKPFVVTKAMKGIKPNLSKGKFKCQHDKFCIPCFYSH